MKGGMVEDLNTGWYSVSLRTMILKLFETMVEKSSATMVENDHRRCLETDVVTMVCVRLVRLVKDGWRPLVGKLSNTIVEISRVAPAPMMSSALLVTSS